MKTRAEIEQELADKRTAESLSKEILEVKSLFKAFLSDFKAVNLNLEHSYRLEDEVSLNELKNAINGIPKEFKIKHTTDKVSYKFLWWYFAISTLVISLSVSFAVYHYKKYEEIKKAEDKAQMKGRFEVYNSLPPNSQEYLQKKYPNIFDVN